MATDATQRRLAAILSADVVGYSRLMARDEDSTVRTLTAYRDEIALLVGQHHGRVVDASGDNLLAEFPSAVDAVRCAIETQQILKVRNASLAAARRMQFRMGIHLGDIRVDGERIYSHGVNIAARLEALAEAGGICVSAAVHEQVQHKLDLPFEDLGQLTLKNIPEPVQAYRVDLQEPGREAPASIVGTREASAQGARFCFAGFVLDADRLELCRGAERIEVQPKVLRLLHHLLENAERTVTKQELLDALWPDTTVSEGSLTSTVGLARRALGESQREGQILRTVHRLGYRMGVPVTRAAREIRQAADGPSMTLSEPISPSPSDRPIVIVLPFTNLSGDPEQEYFADGITEDLTTALSGVPDLIVMSRNLAFLYKGKVVSPRQLHDEFGVRYVVEGSVRRVKDRVRLNIQLIEAPTGGHAWADTYDRVLTDIFELQLEIVETMLGRLRIELLDHQYAALRKKPTSSLSAYECYLRAHALLTQQTPDSLREARELLENAVALDPDYANAHAQLAAVDVGLWLVFQDAKPEHLERAERRLRRVLELDEFSTWPRGNLAALRWVQGRFQEALEAAQEAVRLLPIDIWLYMLAKIQISLGQWQAAQASIDATLRVNPHTSMGGDLWNAQAVLHHVNGRTQEAKTFWERAPQANPTLLSPRLWLSYQYVTEAQQERAEQVACEILEAFPEMTAERALDSWYLYGYQPEPTEHMIAKLREAGLP
jgi:TolB-like protein/class 3 adenylate cyclase/Tfp pilus assembly protein PilF